MPREAASGRLFSFEHPAECRQRLSSAQSKSSALDEAHTCGPQRRLHGPNPPVPNPGDCCKTWPWNSADPRDSQLRRFPHILSRVMLSNCRLAGPRATWGPRP